MPGWNRSAALVFLLAAGPLLGLAACSSRRAEEAFHEAVALEEKASLEAARVKLREVVRRWPDTPAAADARREIEWIDAVLEAAARGPSLEAWDAVRKVSRAAEEFRLAQGRYPRSLDEMIPRWLEGPVRDPWGHRVRYAPAPDGYRVVCYGSDGLPGGQGDATDLVVENGNEVHRGGHPAP